MKEKKNHDIIPPQEIPPPETFNPSRTIRDWDNLPFDDEDLTICVICGKREACDCQIDKEKK